MTGMRLTILFLLAAAGSLTASENEELFEKNVRPLLHEQCEKCHGAQKQKGGLRIDSRAALLKGGDTGPALVPGHADNSLLLKAVRQTDADLQMPPPKEHAKLADAQIAALAAWVNAGAVYPEAAGPVSAKHWAFEPITNPALPLPLSSDVLTSVDAFVLANLKASGTKVAPPADKRTLIRRATYDLTGLPPTPEEVDAFSGDSAPDAFAKLIERLLASPAYGERWGRKWLDVVRYADTAGDNSDFPAPLAWRYRNYVIDAFNRDKPYDQFVREQLAGDLLSKDWPREKAAEPVIATGYLAVARRFGGGKTDPDFYLSIEDTIDTVGKSVLGLTVGCARCHNHKYDPISARDYYGWYGIFASTQFSFPGNEEVQHSRNLVALTANASELPAFETEFAKLEAEAKRLEKEFPAKRKTVAVVLAYSGWRDDAVRQFTVRAITTALTSEKDAAKKKRDEMSTQKPVVEFAYAVAEGKAANARIQKRGEPKDLGDEVPRKNLDLLGGQPIADPASSGRLDLARWCTDAKNPLTARVLVNRVWQGHFGHGIVATPNDFGTRGAPPSDPELLDHLATKFVSSGWSIKALHRMIMLSAAYQRASAPAGEGAHFERRRMDAEELRDTLLSLSGELDRTPGTAHPFPAEGTWHFTQHDPFKANYESSKRSVYLMTQRIQRQPFLALFDGADTNMSTPVRNASTVPTQALFFLNDPFFHARATAFAKRLMSQSDEGQRIVTAYRLCLQRAPNENEIARAKKLVAAYESELDATPGQKPEQRELAAWSALARVILGSNEFLYLD